MGLISRVSSRTYRKIKNLEKQQAKVQGKDGDFLSFSKKFESNEEIKKFYQKKVQLVYF